MKKFFLFKIWQRPKERFDLVFLTHDVREKAKGRIDFHSLFGTKNIKNKYTVYYTFLISSKVFIINCLVIFSYVIEVFKSSPFFFKEIFVNGN